ncbi:MAG: serpin family protein [Sodaliphilus sp.]|nr:serpin family protein [Sodaliphilus sp.]
MRPNGFSTFITVAIALTALTACNDDNGKQEPQEPRANIQLTQEQRVLAENGNEFAINAFKAINSTEDNVLVAPYSLQQTLGMLANGAKGETLDEIIGALHTGAANIGDLNDFYKTVSTGLVGADKRVSLTLANAAWIAKGYTPCSDFTSALKDSYNAETTGIDFSSRDALATINNWASSATSGKIGKAFDYLSPNTVFCLTNAMLFEGKWAKQFNAKATKKETFTNWQGGPETCLMMHQHNDVGISKADDADMLELEYGNGSFVMDVIMPKDGRKINEYVASLSLQRINDLINGIHGSAEVSVGLPRFEARYEYDLIDKMKGLGVKKIFDGGDLSGIANASGLAVTQYLQRLWVKVDEEGTKVASVTASSGEITAVMGGVFIVDSPFVYMIRERSTGVILAIGKVQTMAGMQ